MGNSFWRFYQKTGATLASKVSGSVYELLKSPTGTFALDQTRKSTALDGKCYEPDGDPVSPFNYFYYFNNRQGSCPQNPQGFLQVAEVRDIPVKTTYPEYHKLFADHKLEALVFYNQVNDEGNPAAGYAAARNSGRDISPRL